MWRPGSTHRAICYSVCVSFLSSQPGGSRSLPRGGLQDTHSGFSQIFSLVNVSPLVTDLASALHVEHESQPPSCCHLRNSVYPALMSTQKETDWAEVFLVLFNILISDQVHRKL